MNIEQDRDYIAADAARLLGVHPVTLRRWIKTGLLPARKLPNLRYVVRGRDIIEFLERRGVSPNALQK